MQKTKLFQILIICMALLGCASNKSVKQPGGIFSYSSPHGFTIDLPENWRILSAEENNKNSKVLNIFEALKGVNPAVQENLAKLLRIGEVYIDVSTVESKYVSYIWVGKVLSVKNETVTLEINKQRECESGRPIIQKKMSRPIINWYCDLIEVAERKTLYLEYDGPESGVKFTQYLILNNGESFNSTLIFLSNHKSQNFESSKKITQAIVSTIKLPSFSPPSGEDPIATLNLESIEPKAGSILNKDSVLEAKIKYSISDYKKGRYVLAPQFQTTISGFTFSAIKGGFENSFHIQDQEGEATITYPISKEWKDPKLARPIQVWFYLMILRDSGEGHIIGKLGPIEYQTD